MDVPEWESSAVSGIAVACESSRYNCAMFPDVPADLFEALTSGRAYSFRDKLHKSLPMARTGVYTIWRGLDFLYVGISGRGLNTTHDHKKMRGIKDRLDSHRNGRRSGNQFAVYVCDRLVLPTLTAAQIQCVGAGELSLDALTRVYIHEYLLYRFVSTDSYTSAIGIENAFARGETPAGMPMLNPNKKPKTVSKPTKTRKLPVETAI